MRYIWDRNIHWRKERRGSKTLAETSDGTFTISIFFEDDYHAYRITEDHLYRQSGKIQHRDQGLESSMSRAEDILEKYKRGVNG